MSRSALFKKWVPVETYPIIAVVSGAVAGATFYLYRLAQGPEVTWNRHGDWRPWDKIKQDENIKFLSYNPDFWQKRKQQVAEAKAAATASA